MMNWNLSVHKTLPDRRDHWWQVELLPHLSVMKQEYGVFIVLGWLFWTVEVSRMDNDKRYEEYCKEVSGTDY